MALNEELQKNLLSGKELFSDVLGAADTKKELKSALLMGRHVIILGPSGIGKTTLAKNVARLLPDIVANDCPYHCNPDAPICPECRKKACKKRTISGESRFIRVQGSPDLTAEDLLGDIDPIKALQCGPLSMEAFTPGKIFKANNGVLFFDELNRCPEKLQNAMLQVLEERKATIGSYDVDIPTDFIFIGTMNPHDSSTERLSDVFLDRFDVIRMGYPENEEIEEEIIVSKGKSIIEFPKPLLKLMTSFIRSIRESDQLEKLPSVRASLGLYERAQANAMLGKKKAVELSDVKKALHSVLSHRIRLKPAIRYIKGEEEFINEEFSSFMDKHPFKDDHQEGDELEKKGGSR